MPNFECKSFHLPQTQSRNDFLQAIEIIQSHQVLGYTKSWTIAVTYSSNSDELFHCPDSLSIILLSYNNWCNPITQQVRIAHHTKDIWGEHFSVNNVGYSAFHISLFIRSPSFVCEFRQLDLPKHHEFNCSQMVGEFFWLELIQTQRCVALWILQCTGNVVFSRSHQELWISSRNLGILNLPWQPVTSHEKQFRCV